MKTEFQSSIDRLNSFLFSVCFFFSSDSDVSAINLSSIGVVSFLEETFTSFSKVLLLITFSTFFLVSFISPGKKETILNKAISKPLDKLGAISISLFASRPI